jgi:phospholipase C
MLGLLVVSLVIAFLTGCALGVKDHPGQNNNAGLSAINHVIFVAQENRSFDTYFGHLNDYRMANGLPADVDGMPANASNPADDGSMVAAFHLSSMCIENTSAAWATSHINFNRLDQTSNTPTMDGFVVEAAAAAKGSGGNDTKGVRAMGFYTSQDLISHYFLASQFGTSDRWFAPAPIETEPNRMYLVAATSVGHAHAPKAQVKATTIFDLLDQKGISWKIYLVDPSIPSELGFFANFVQSHPDKFVPIAQYNTDLQNGTLPSVVYIDRAPGKDEHPGTGASIQVGAAFVTSLVTSLMSSQYWKDSVFVMTFDEHGGLYDHVPSPTNVVSPDGIPPQDLFQSPPDPPPSDPPGDFTRYGFRIPVVVISPFSKQHFVSHTVTDSTAVLKLIETRWGLPNLTKRDAAAMDMSEFFDFANVPWKTPPTVPAQPTNGPCTDTLP